MDLSFLKLNIEKIGLRMRSIFSVRGEVRVDVDKRKLEIDTLNQIQEQKNLNAPITINVLTVGPDNVKALSGVIEKITSGGVDIPSLVSSDSSREATLPETPADGEHKVLLRSCLAEYQKNPQFLLDIGRLLFLYEERLNIDFNEEELVFVLQSSLKNNFPFWFWAFLYREKFDNVVPLLKCAFATSDIKIRLEIVGVLERFTNTAEDVVELAQSENNELVLGAMVIKLFKKKEEDRAQRIIANAISRKLIPDLDYKDIKTLDAVLGKNEKKFLLDTISNGWSNEKVKALNILSVTASEDDLPTLESLLENETYRETTFSTLHCIARIGKTNKKALIEKQLEDAKWEEFFIQALETLVAVEDRAILPQLFKWLKDTSSFVWKFSSELHEWQLADHIEKAILALMDKDFYEVVIQDILSVPDGKYRNLYIWKQFNLLKEVKNNEIVELIINEKRLVDYPEWKELVQKVNANETIEKKEREGLLALATPADYTTAMLSLRELWKISSQEEALLLKGTIENLRNDFSERLHVFAIGNYSQEQKDLALKGLDYFLGENRTYNHVYGKRNWRKSEEEKNDPFSILIDDIGKFERIEDEYISFILQKKDGSTKQFLLDHIGRPYEKIYDAISPKWTELQKDEIESPLNNLIRDHDNPLIKLAALGAGRRMGIIDNSTARIEIIKIFIKARERLKAHGRRLDDDWLVNHIIYYGAINALSEIGNISDLSLIEESINRETILDRNFFRYSYFHDITSMRKLLQILDTVKKDGERKSIFSTLDTLDYEWTKEVLGIEA